MLSMTTPRRLSSLFARLVLATAVAVPLASSPVLAQGHGGGSHGEGGGHGFHGGPGHFHGFHDGRHDFHGGFHGGWGIGWGIGLGAPYYWDWPYYGYPPVYVSPAPVYLAPPAGPPPEASWYYCPNPAGYYPYVQTCPGPWQQVPARPPQAPAGK